MFDDPKKELQALEDQLLAAEAQQETSELDDAEFEKLYDEILEEFGPRKASGGDAPVQPEPPIRNFANGYGGVVHSRPIGTDGDEILPDDEPVPTEKGGRGLVVLAVLECAAIAGVVVYWALNFL
ncbi:MAG: hypothetical protein IJZ39_13380 [Oscillospiraceae bacterium]|nr:hypothetical protein [Oscillospiraceae bacterium]